MRFDAEPKKQKYKKLSHEAITRQGYETSENGCKKRTLASFAAEILFGVYGTETEKCIEAATLESPIVKIGQPS